jgi:hypothetical protein
VDFAQAWSDPEQVHRDQLGFCSSPGSANDAGAVCEKVVAMTEQNQSGDITGAQTDAPDSGADYDPDLDQDSEPTNMAPPGERPSDMEATD